MNPHAAYFALWAGTDPLGLEITIIPLFGLAFYATLGGELTIGFAYDSKGNIALYGEGGIGVEAGIKSPINNLLANVLDSVIDTSSYKGNLNKPKGAINKIVEGGIIL